MTPCWGTSFLSAADDPRRCTRRFALAIDPPTVRGSIALKGSRIDSHVKVPGPDTEWWQEASVPACNAWLG
jgi:hypothetical protein